jgi:hypothetical protein
MMPILMACTHRPEACPVVCKKQFISLAASRRTNTTLVRLLLHPHPPALTRKKTRRLSTRTTSMANYATLSNTECSTHWPQFKALHQHHADSFRGSASAPSRPATSPCSHCHGSGPSNNTNVSVEGSISLLSPSPSNPVCGMQLQKPSTRISLQPQSVTVRQMLPFFSPSSFHTISLSPAFTSV